MISVSREMGGNTLYGEGRMISVSIEMGGNTLYGEGKRSQ